MDRIYARLARACTLSLILAGTAGAAIKQQAAAQQPGTEQFKAVANGPLRVKEDLLNQQVKNQNGENLGTVEEVVVDSTGRIQYVIMSPAGDLKMQDQSVTVPWHALSSTEEGHLLLPMTKEQVAEAPSFKKGEWPDLAAGEWNTVVYAYYGLVYVPPKRGFSELDIDKDGKLSRAEASQYDRLAANFNKVDQNQDQQIEQAEFAAFEESLQPGGTTLEERGAQQ